MDNNKLGTKPHYQILDGLRGVAAIIVVFFHLAEPLSSSHLDNIVNHGYLAVDFFFLLSGFVIGYAYDDRWNKISFGGFFKRRLVRLQPMVIMGMIVGAIGFYFQASSIMPLINGVPFWKMLLIMLVGLLAKNAILIVEYAVQRRKAGMTLMQSALEASQLRLRPILMTSFAFIVGLLPLTWAKGGSALGDRAIGTSALGGMLTGVLLGVFIIPILFVIFQYLQEKLTGRTGPKEISLSE